MKVLTPAAVKALEPVLTKAVDRMEEQERRHREEIRELFAGFEERLAAIDRGGEEAYR